MLAQESPAANALRQHADELAEVRRRHADELKQLELTLAGTTSCPPGYRAITKGTLPLQGASELMEPSGSLHTKRPSLPPGSAWTAQSGPTGTDDHWGIPQTTKTVRSPYRESNHTRRSLGIPNASSHTTKTPMSRETPVFPLDVDALNSRLRQLELAIAQQQTDQTNLADMLQQGMLPQHQTEYLDSQDPFTVKHYNTPLTKSSSGNRLGNTKTRLDDSVRRNLAAEHTNFNSGVEPSAPHFSSRNNPNGLVYCTPSRPTGADYPHLYGADVQSTPYNTNFDQLSDSAPIAFRTNLHKNSCVKNTTNGLTPSDHLYLNMLKNFKIRPYQGKESAKTFTEWLKDFEDLMHLTNIDPVHWKGLLKLNLGDKPSLFVRSVDSNSLTYHSLVHLLTESYDTGVDVASKFKFSSLKQQPDETVAAFLRRLEIEYKRAYPTGDATQDDQLMIQALKGVKPQFLLIVPEASRARDYNELKYLLKTVDRLDVIQRCRGDMTPTKTDTTNSDTSKDEQSSLRVSRSLTNVTGKRERRTSHDDSSSRAGNSQLKDITNTRSVRMLDSSASKQDEQAKNFASLDYQNMLSQQIDDQDSEIRKLKEQLAALTNKPSPYVDYPKYMNDVDSRRQYRCTYCRSDTHTTVSCYKRLKRYGADPRPFSANTKLPPYSNPVEDVHRTIRMLQEANTESFDDQYDPPSDLETPLSYEDYVNVVDDDVFYVHMLKRSHYVTDSLPSYTLSTKLNDNTGEFCGEHFDTEALSSSNLLRTLNVSEGDSLYRDSLLVTPTNSYRAAIQNHTKNGVVNALQTASPPQDLTVFNPLYNRSTTDTDGYVYPDARLEPIITSLVSADTIALNTGRALPELPGTPGSSDTSSDSQTKSTTLLYKSTNVVNKLCIFTALVTIISLSAGFLALYLLSVQTFGCLALETNSLSSSQSQTMNLAKNALLFLADSNFTGFDWTSQSSVNPTFLSELTKRSESTPFTLSHTVSLVRLALASVRSLQTESSDEPMVTLVTSFPDDYETVVRVRQRPSPYPLKYQRFST